MKQLLDMPVDAESAVVLIDAAMELGVCWKVAKLFYPNAGYARQACEVAATDAIGELAQADSLRFAHAVRAVLLFGDWDGGWDEDGDRIEGAGWDTPKVAIGWSVE